MSANEKQSKANRPEQAQGDAMKQPPTGDWTDVERRILEARKKAGEVIALDPDTVRRRIRRIAYHEAGHVAARMFTGLESSHVVSVSIIPEGATDGRERSERNITEFTLLNTSTSDENSPWRRCAARCLLLELLAGMGAEMRIAALDERKGMLDEDATWMEDDTGGTDRLRIHRIAETVARPRMPARRILALAQKWTDEMLALPEVWCTVGRLVATLLERGEIDDHEEIMKTCREIRGLSFRLPKWKRRLHPVERLL